MEYLKKLTELLNTLSPLNHQSSQLIFEKGILHFYKKNDILFREHTSNSFEYFQMEGVTHRFNKDVEGRVITTGIYPHSSVITPHFARTRDGRSIFSVQALTDSIHLKIPIESFEKLRKSNQEIWTLGQRIVENEFRNHMNYEVMFRSYTAKDRLLEFRKQFRHLENTIPLTVIASFLGITPVSLSRLRNEIAKES